MIAAKSDSGFVLDEVKIARGFFSRFVGLMGKKEVRPSFGLFFPGCKSIHCFFMRVPIDVIYLDEEMGVVGVETVSPWKIGHAPAHVSHILEVREGGAASLQIGDHVSLHTANNA